MTPLRHRLITAIRRRGFSPPQESYFGAVRELAKYTRRSPDTLRGADGQHYFEYLVVTERGLAPISANQIYVKSKVPICSTLLRDRSDSELAISGHCSNTSSRGITGTIACSI